MGDTPHGMPVIGAGSTAHVKVGALATAISFLVGFTIWLTNLHSDVESLKLQQAAMNTKLDTIINTMIHK